jgi:hypothetical protein
MEPNDQLTDKFGRAVIALVNDDDEVVRRVLACSNQRPISCVVYSDSFSTRRASYLLRKGVAELIDWPCQFQEFAAAVSTAETVLSSSTENATRRSDARERIASLSRREKEVLGFVVNGKTNQEIAKILSLSARTVEVHRLNCNNRLGVNKKGDAIRIALDSGCYTTSVECSDPVNSLKIESILGHSAA